MQSGKLNKQINLQSPSQAPNGTGGFTVTWTTVATIWAAIWPVSGKELITGNTLLGTISHRVRIRYRRGISSSWRIKYGSRYFAIIAPPVNPNEANEFLDLMCLESVG